MSAEAPDRPHAATSAPRLFLALLVSLTGGFFAINSYFSDSDYSRWGRIVYVLASHFLPGLLVGALTPRRWYLAALVAWGALLLGALGVSDLLQGKRGMALVGTLLYYLLLLPAAALLGGFAGGKLARRWPRAARGLAVAVGVAVAAAIVIAALAGVLESIQRVR